jgi:hypothetical protein
VPDSAEAADMVLLSEDRWFCPLTALVLIRRPVVPVWRVFQYRFGSPLNPPLRQGTVLNGWGRYDLDGHLTLYGAGTRRGAFLESLAYAMYLPEKIPLSQLFEDVAETDDPIAQEWLGLSHMQPNGIPANWRDDRRCVDMFLRNDGYYVDISAAETIGALRRSAEAWAPGRYSRQPNLIDIAGLAGGDRILTCAAADWLRCQIPCDHETIGGIRYLSKHGSDVACWARWAAAREGDDAISTLREVATHGPPAVIGRNDPDLEWAAHQLGLRVW